MSKPDIYERVQVLEDEVKLQDSTLDARTRKLWGEIQKLQAEVKELRERTAPAATSAKEPRA
jgi:regulator of replication initiation timing